MLCVICFALCRCHDHGMLNIDNFPTHLVTVVCEYSIIERFLLQCIISRVYTFV